MAGAPQYLAEVKSAAQVIKNAKALIITAGAGMGVDSGLPDFRGPEGFWKAYPPLQKRGLQLQEMSTPKWFLRDPAFAWGFFGHRYHLYSKTTPHHGFKILLDWAKEKEHGYFVYTSNVDGHFQKAGFDEDRVVECHGSLNFLQCVDPTYGNDIWPMPEGLEFDVDENLNLTSKNMPRGPPGSDGSLARPNVLMFGDYGWQEERTEVQENKYFSYQKSVMKDGGIPFAVVEIGCGNFVPTVRMQSESLVGKNNGTLIRINPRDVNVPTGHISLPMKGLEALQAIQSQMDSDS